MESGALPDIVSAYDCTKLSGMLFAACGESRATMLLPAVRSAIEAGMRMGELLSLEWRNVDTAQRVATLPDTKTGDARQVPLSNNRFTDFKKRHRGLCNLEPITEFQPKI